MGSRSDSFAVPAKQLHRNTPGLDFVSRPRGLRATRSPKDSTSAAYLSSSLCERCLSVLSGTVTSGAPDVCRGPSKGALSHHDNLQLHGLDCMEVHASPSTRNHSYARSCISDRVACRPTRVSVYNSKLMLL